MKDNKHPQGQEPHDASRQIPAATLEQNARAFTPSPDEVARRAYFAYVNEGSKPGHDVQHWLEAEAHLLSERNRTRIHGFHNQT